MNKEKVEGILKSTLKGLKWFAKSFIWIAPVLFALDLISKSLAETYLSKGPVTVIKGFFTLELLYNTGAAWGKFSEYTVWLAVISAVASVAMIVFLAWKWKKLNNWYRICLLLLISGALGNFIDRFRCAVFNAPGVIDFLKFTFGSYVFPTFNLADSYLTIGCILLILYVIFSDLITNSKKKKEENEPLVSTEVIKKNDELFKKDEEKKDEKKDGK